MIDVFPTPLFVDVLREATDNQFGARIEAADAPPVVVNGQPVCFKSIYLSAVVGVTVYATDPGAFMRSFVCADGNKLAIEVAATLRNRGCRCTVSSVHRFVDGTLRLSVLVHFVADEPLVDCALALDKSALCACLQTHLRSAMVRAEVAPGPGADAVAAARAALSAESIYVLQDPETPNPAGAVAHGVFRTTHALIDMGDSEHAQLSDEWVDEFARRAIDQNTLVPRVFYHFIPPENTSVLGGLLPRAGATVYLVPYIFGIADSPDDIVVLVFEYRLFIGAPPVRADSSGGPQKRASCA